MNHEELEALKDIDDVIAFGCGIFSIIFFVGYALYA